MIGVEMYHAIVTLRKNGRSIRQIASYLQISKTTVIKYCKPVLEEKKDHCFRRTGSSEFDIAEDYIRNRLAEKPIIRASCLYDEVMKRYPEINRAQRTFRAYVRAIRESMPKQVQRYFAIIETEPGKQVQVDPGEMIVDMKNGTRLKVHFVVFVLSSSRYIFVHWQLQPYKTATFIEAHRQAFQYFEGIPAECVYDQTKLVALKEQYREVIYNRVFHEFALRTGFHPHVCEGYDPQSKGKVERMVEEVKDAFLYPGTFRDLQDIQAQGFQWLNRFNRRLHATTHLVPAEAWQSEKLLLKPVPESLIKPIIRNADKQGLISFQGNKYSVPQVYQQHEVIIQAEEGNLLILDTLSYKVIASHIIPSDKGKLVTSSNHYRDYRVEFETLMAKSLEMMKVYPDGEELVKKLVRDNVGIKRDQLQALGKLFHLYDEQIWLAALPLMKQQLQLRATLIEKILQTTERNMRLSTLAISHESAVVQGSDIQRSLNDYMRVLK